MVKEHLFTQTAQNMKVNMHKSLFISWCDHTCEFLFRQEVGWKTSGVGKANISTSMVIFTKVNGKITFDTDKERTSTKKQVFIFLSNLVFKRSICKSDPLNFS